MCYVELEKKSRGKKAIQTSLGLLLAFTIACGLKSAAGRLLCNYGGCDFVLYLISLRTAVLIPFRPEFC